ncbi:hypothetical protein CYMTET_33352 [Cymbomonas tetramitiformis]|uniref:Uncharacterized protein n=1 Tax=Cymbomonas tetramitiformis TaxID=36881 RepID=A0AAE0KQZ3_9CHLO|nr:hypothetical protein CYMTET_33352 [Cymbomonas tetramitiformis]
MVTGFYSLGVWYYCAAYGTECKDPCTSEEFIVWQRENSYKDNCWSTLSITPADDFVLKVCQSGVLLSVFFSGQLIYAFYQLKFKKSVRIAVSGAICGLVSATFAILSAVQAPDRLKSLSDVVDEFEGLTFDWKSYNFSWYSGIIGAAANCYSSWILVSCHIESIRRVLESAGKADGDDSSSDEEEGQMNKGKALGDLSDAFGKVTQASKDLNSEKEQKKADKKSGNKVKHHRRSVVAKKDHKAELNKKAKNNQNKI